MKINTVAAGVVAATAIRGLATVGALSVSGSWWVAVIAVVVLDWIEGAGRREMERWLKNVRR